MAKKKQRAKVPAKGSSRRKGSKKALTPKRPKRSGSKSFDAPAAVKAAEQKIAVLEEELDRAKEVTTSVLEDELGKSKKLAAEVREQLHKIRH